MAKRKAEVEEETENKQQRTTDIAITDTTFEFLTDLEKNNDKGWMTENKKTYNKVKDNFIKFTQYQLTDLQISDSSLSMLDAKDCIFRINRDVRFSAVKAPYKNHFAAAFAQGGKKSGRASYYLHIEPNGKSMIGAGMYLPPPTILDKIRKAIAKDSQLLKESLVTEGFQKSFNVENGLDLLLQTDDKLKTVPKGYPKDHADIELLRLKSFAVGRTFTDEEVLKPEFKDSAAKIFQSVIPLVQVLNSYLE
ncbi:hypothetical protein HDV01_007592 [Terramyces sp. JEL0728]|nr:hypothetical protein HDV01_007592 [Terramyces sp. JEL0728]